MFLNEKEIREMVGVCRATIWRWERAGIFPKRRQLGPRRVAWLRSEIEKWAKTRETVDDSVPEVTEK